MNARPIGEALVALGVMLLLATVVTRCLACIPREVVDRAVSVPGGVAYTAALAECRAKGKDAGSYAVYAACADQADRIVGLDGGAP